MRLFQPIIDFTSSLVRKEQKSFLSRIFLNILKIMVRSNYAYLILAEYVWLNLAIENNNIENKNSIKIIVLNEERYRADLLELSNRDDVILYYLPSNIQNLINSIWLSDIRNISNSETETYLKSNNIKVLQSREKLKNLLKNIIRILNTKYKIDCIITCTFYYKQDREWESASVEAAVPFIVLHKENMKDPSTHNANIERYKKHGYRFNGTKLLLANRLEKYVLLKAGCVSEDKLEVVGSLRMDSLYRRVNSKKCVNRNKVVLFSTHHRSGLLQIENVKGWFNEGSIEEGFIHHFDKLHSNFAKLALEFPHLEFVIKTKWLGVWEKKIQNAVKSHINVNVSDIKNLLITDKILAHDLIDSAMVVVGLNSTTLIEAKLAGVPVILPIFEEAATKYFDSNIYFKKYMDIFSVANSPDEMNNLLVDAILGVLEKQKQVPNEMIQDYLGYFDGRVAERTMAVFKREVSQSKSILNLNFN
jgi:hypothetical protein